MQFIKKYIIFNFVFFCSALIFFSVPVIASASTIKVVLSNLGLVGYWPMNESSGTLSRDYSGNGNNGTLTGGSAWAAGQKEGAISLDGSGDYVLVSDSNSLDVTTNITISAWVNPVSASNNGIVMKGNALGNSQGVYSLIVANSVVRMRFGTDEPSAVLASTALTNNVWTHVVATYDGTTARIYLNGVLNNSNAHTGAISADANPLYIGQYYNTPYSFNGKLDDVRIYSRALSASEVLRLYRGEGAKFGVTQSTNSLATGLVGHWSFDGNKTNWTSATAGTATDSSGNSNTGTLTNMSQTTTPIDGVIGQALKFDGTNDYVQVSDNSQLRLSGNFTISLWMKSTGSQSNKYLIGKLNSAGNNNDYGVIFGYNANKVEFFCGSSCTIGYPVGADTKITVSDTSWHQITYSCDGSTFRGYLDGVSVITPISSTCVLNTSTNVLVFGLFNAATLSTDFNGSLDDIRFYSRALSAAEIKRLYNMGRPTVVSANYLLDNTPNAVAAYSVRKLRSSYTGYAMKVRRDSDNATQDIGFIVRNLDTTSLLAFCGSGSCYVDTWYDQSGNSKNLIQTGDTTKQPRIVSSGSVLTGSNSKPVIVSDGVNDVMSTTITLPQPFSVQSVFETISPGGNAIVYDNDSNNGLLHWPSSTLIYIYAGGTQISLSALGSTWYISQAVYNGSSSVARLNGANDSAGSGMGTNSGNNFTVFGRATSLPSNTKMHEIIFWGANVSNADRGTARLNANNYFQVY